MPPADWYLDPTDPTRGRFWDGRCWTPHLTAIPEGCTLPAFPAAAESTLHHPPAAEVPRPPLRHRHRRARKAKLAAAGRVVVVLAALVATAVGSHLWWPRNDAPSRAAPMCSTGTVATPRGCEVAATAVASAQPVDVPASAPTAEDTTGVESATVSVRDGRFEPATVTVTVGGSVTWRTDTGEHAIVDAATGQHGSQTFTRGSDYGHTYTEAGTFVYGCALHPAMRGTIYVVPPT